MVRRGFRGGTTTELRSVATTKARGAATAALHGAATAALCAAANGASWCGEGFAVVRQRSFVL